MSDQHIMVMHPQQERDIVDPEGERRKRQLAGLAKARAVRAANVLAGKQHKALAGADHAVDPPVHVPARRAASRRRKTAKTRLTEAIVQHKAAKKGPPDGWLDGIHHMPDGCPIACKGGICIITMENVCAHPDTNLQAYYLRGDHQEVVDRFQAARHELRRLDAERSLKK